MGTPYREHDRPQPRSTPAMLECWLRDGDRHRWVRAVYVKVMGTFVACWFLVTGGAPLAVAPAIALGIAWAWRDVRRRRGDAVRLEVHGKSLRVERGASAPLDLELDELLEVRLDTKKQSRNMTVARADGVNSVFGAGSGHNIDLDVSRIELVLDGDEILLSPEFISHSPCMESLREIRLFLRAHGWKPLDERARRGAAPRSPS